MKKQKYDWGVRLTDHPFAGLKNADMFMQADISKRPTQGTEFRFYFSGTDAKMPMRKADLLVWIERLRAMYDAATEEAK